MQIPGENTRIVLWEINIWYISLALSLCVCVCVCVCVCSLHHMGHNWIQMHSRTLTLDALLTFEITYLFCTCYPNNSPVTKICDHGRRFCCLSNLFQQNMLLFESSAGWVWPSANKSPKTHWLCSYNESEQWLDTVRKDWITMKKS